MRVLAFSAVVGIGLLGVLGCGDDSIPGAGCDLDTDCAAGQYCGAGGCRFDCREARDCTALGAGATCDARGRCVVAMDGGTGDASAGPCARACDDGVFCNGVEACDPASPAADEAGCVVQPPACAAGDCDEATDACDPCRDPDEDRDGYDDRACGGPDCDDHDARRSPGAHEVCDDASLDEDCNRDTLGAPSEDADGDGAWPPATPATPERPSVPCCNTVAAAGGGTETLCGADCADRPGVDRDARGRFPGALEICNDLDDDCNGVVDDGIRLVLYRDADCDGEGIRVPEPMRGADGELPPEVAAYARLGCAETLGMTACVRGATPGWRTSNVDCNDSDATWNTRAVDGCEAARNDENCDGTPNESCACTLGEMRTCGTRLVDGVCSVRAISCVMGPSAPRWEDCPGVPPVTVETACDGVDEDCDGVADDGLTATLYRDEDADGRGDAPGGYDPPARVHAGCPRPGYVASQDDCCDRDPTAYPGQLSFFDHPTACGSGFDFDCDGRSEPRYPDVSPGCDGSPLDRTRCLSGWFVWGGVPACGVRGTFVECSYPWSGGSLTCAPGTSYPLVQPCR